ncbi:MAG: hypothetical protein COA75_00925 [Cellvibrionales bacterium]|nr:MAG: hypothetical protein COA75_00925 [Cellvibrionales bacterium]
MAKKLCLLILLGSTLLVTGCASPPAKPNNICDIFTEKRSWYKAAMSSSKRWGGPVSVPMAIMYQESGFKHDAKPPMRYFLWIIPYGRASSAYGYAQVKTGTWGDYQKDAGSMFSDRDDFGDAMDFVFWYMDKSQKRNGVSKWDAYNQYLNYHEGHGGFARGSYKKKAWLKGVARKVERRSKTYSAQFGQCKKSLEKGWLRRLLF